MTLASILTEYKELITDPAHLMLEVSMILIVDVILLGLALPLLRSWVRRHDAEHHPDDFYGDDQYDDDYDDWDMYYDEDAEEQYADYLAQARAADEAEKAYYEQEGLNRTQFNDDHYVEYIYKDGVVVQVIEYKNGQRISHERERVIEYNPEDLNGY